MTAASPTARRYATALFALAEEAGQQPAVAAAAASMAAALADHALVAALTNPLLSAARRTTLAATMAKSVKAPKALASTFGVLAANNRLSLLPGVLEGYLELHDTASGITHVELASAVPLTDAQRTKLTALISKYTKSADIRLEETIDARLQGGFRAIFNGLVWDMSLAGNLARLATRLRNSVTNH